ncbi:hypothetical protein [Cerasicoccus maritimus]|uniref:hypothetical protein n=1 Tax=Cerasicoccus maritimus TaxID=490089 RepID=UPI0028527A1C|nr:hypothetical protein [Cerasicoccus maritimus]
MAIGRISLWRFLGLLGWMSAFSAQAQIFPVPTNQVVPATVEVESEEVDGYTARRMLITAGDLRLAGPPPRPWTFYSGEKGASVNMDLPYNAEVSCALYLMPEGALVPGSLAQSIRAYASALEAKPGVKAEFVRDEETKAVRIDPPAKKQVREFYNGDGEVIAKRERVNYPHIFGQRFYEIDYVLYPGSEREVAIGEFWFNLGEYQALVLLKCPKAEFEKMATMLRNNLKGFYVEDATSGDVSMN